MNTDPASYPKKTYSEIAQSPEFRALLERKTQFLVPMSLFFFAFYFTLPVMTAYFPAVLNHRVIGAITGAWLFAFAQFAMIWTLCGIYVKKARTFDTEAAVIVAENSAAKESGADHV